MLHRLAGSVGALAVAGLVTAIGCRGAEPGPASPASGSGPVQEITSATYVGRTQCVRCHEAEEQAWQGSHHDLAMQEATPETVLGNFADATFTYGGTTTRFSTRDGK